MSQQVTVIVSRILDIRNWICISDWYNSETLTIVLKCVVSALNIGVHTSIPWYNHPVMIFLFPFDYRKSSPLSYVGLWKPAHVLNNSFWIFIRKLKTKYSQRKHIFVIFKIFSFLGFSNFIMFLDFCLFNLILPLNLCMEKNEMNKFTEGKNRVQNLQLKEQVLQTSSKRIIPERSYAL